MHAQLTGFIPSYKVPAALKVAGLEQHTIDVDGVRAKYTGLDKRFHWLAFVKALEKSTKAYAQMPRSDSHLARSPSILKQLEGARAKYAQGTTEALPPLMRVHAIAQSRRTLKNSPSLLLRGPAHPAGVPPRDATGGRTMPPRSFSQSSLGFSGSLSSLLKPSGSMASLRSTGSVKVRRD
jgi:hypothetical protein